MTTVKVHRDHPIAHALVGVLGVLAGVATVWLVLLGLVILDEWSGYVGHESSTALAILVTVGVIPAALAWAGAAVAHAVDHRPGPTSRRRHEPTGQAPGPDA